MSFLFFLTWGERGMNALEGFIFKLALLNTATILVPVLFQKRSFADVLQNRYSWKFCKFHRKTPVLQSLFYKVASFQTCKFIKKKLQHRCFPVKLAKFLRTAFLKEHLPWPHLIFGTTNVINTQCSHQSRDLHCKSFDLWLYNV